MIIEYNLKNNKESIEFELENKSSLEWKFLDDQELILKDKIYIEDESFEISFKLNLYKKNVNLHIFSVLAEDDCGYFGLEYPFYLIWINNSNVYTFVQNNKKSNEIFDELNGIPLKKEYIQIFLEGLFRNPPTYYTESTSRSKSIKNLEELPDKCYYSRDTGRKTQWYTLNPDGTSTESHQTGSCTLEPI